MLRDPWDRLIVATAIELDVAPVTADRAMHGFAANSALSVIW
jgi:PIN domain nuclease of toxin-antitoxin system